MLSAACLELPPLPAAESAQSMLPLRPIAVTFAPDLRQARRTPQTRRGGVPVVRVPPYSRIVFRGGSAIAR